MVGILTVNNYLLPALNCQWIVASATKTGIPIGKVRSLALVSLVGTYII